MSTPVNPLLQRAGLPVASQGARHTAAHQQQWQQQMARAQGQTIVAQSRSTLPAFESHAQSAEPKVLRLPTGLQLVSPRPATPGQIQPTHSDIVLTKTPQSPQREASREGSGFLREATHSPSAKPLEHEATAVSIDADMSSLVKALQPLDPEGASDFRVELQHTEEGLVIALHVSGPLAQQADALRAATLVFFARQGFYVAGISLNGAAIFEARHTADSLDPIAMKD